jgi:hypothetical protein
LAPRLETQVCLIYQSGQKKKKKAYLWVKSSYFVACNFYVTEGIKLLNKMDFKQEEPIFFSI